jgi:acetyltransferase-like isoleucine patch superfamily enzyme
MRSPNSTRSPIEKKNLLLNKTTPLTSKEKALFGYFGVGAKIKPPFRILNPHRIHIGDRTSIQEHCHVNAFQDLSFLLDYVAPRYRDDFDEADYRYDSEIAIGRENQIGRFFFVSCTRRIELDDNVLLSERVFIGDNNHSFSHREVPIMQQPNKTGKPIHVKFGSWVGAGAVLLSGTEIGKLSVVGANSVCKEKFPDYSVIGPEPSRLLFRRFESKAKRRA